MKKYITVIMIVLFLSFIALSIMYKSSAIGLDALDNPDAFIDNSDDSSELIDIGNIIVGLVRTVGESISVVILLILGIKYVMGSVEERATYKQSMIPYVIGAVLIFAGAAVTDIIYQAFN